jgi:hypothetical protein
LRRGNVVAAEQFRLPFIQPWDPGEVVGLFRSLTAKAEVLTELALRGNVPCGIERRLSEDAGEAILEELPDMDLINFVGNRR